MQVRVSEGRDYMEQALKLSRQSNAQVTLLATHDAGIFGTGVASPLDASTGPQLDPQVPLKRPSTSSVSPIGRHGELCYFTIGMEGMPLWERRRRAGPAFLPTVRNFASLAATDPVQIPYHI